MSSKAEQAACILGIETSCDETGVAIYHARHGLLAEVLYSQIALHRDYGGVVPELASRDHVRKILPQVRDVLQQAELAAGDISAIAYTAGPGLMGALLVGAVFARALAWAWQVPALPIHHMEGHLLAVMLEEQRPAFPFLALLVSGGHTLLVEVEALGVYRVLGQSLDDAVGEAFDKTAKLLGLSYPGGPALAKLALQGEPGRYQFPRPMTDRPGLDFSFSGLKTAVMNVYRQASDPDAVKADIARGFEEAVVETLLIKCQRALRQTGLTRLVVAGGVGANQRLRAGLTMLAEQNNSEIFLPRPQFCTDNGAMIAYAGCCYWQAAAASGVPLTCDSGVNDDLGTQVRPRWPLAEALDS